MSGAAPRSPARLYRLHQAMLRRLRARGFTYLATLAVLLSVGTALIHVTLRLEVLRIGYELSEETRTRHELIQQGQRLRLELATRKDPGMVEQKARGLLKMVPPDPQAIRPLRARDRTVDSAQQNTHSSQQERP